jgi:hypothetical protein
MATSILSQGRKGIAERERVLIRGSGVSFRLLQDGELGVCVEDGVAVGRGVGLGGPVSTRLFEPLSHASAINITLRSNSNGCEDSPYNYSV